MLCVLSDESEANQLNIKLNGGKYGNLLFN